MSIRASLVDSLPNSQNKHSENDMAGSKENKNDILVFSLYLLIMIQLERQRRMRGLPAVAEKPKHISADDLGDR